MRRPNILFILTDQWHPRCTGYAGHPVVRTPHLDAMAERGMIFERMYTPVPLCAPARASIFTGLTPRGHGVRMNGIPLRPEISTFVEALRQAGYRTHGVGKIHFGTYGIPNGRLLNEVDPNECPEASALWWSGRIKKLPLPYFGFETIDFANGDGQYVYGDYLHWLEREHPESARMLKEPGTIGPTSPAFKLYNRETFKWALPAAHHQAPWIVDRCIDFLGTRKAKTSLSSVMIDEPPFFLFCSFNDPHPPFAAPHPYCEAYDPKLIPPPLERAGELDNLPPHFRAMVEEGIITSGNRAEPMQATRPHYRECAAQYFGQIKLFDDQLGRLLAALKASGEEENTLVVFTADHGEALGDHGLWGKGPYHFDGVIRVPCLASWPGRISPGSRVRAPCTLLDLAPTFLDCAHVDIPGSHPVDPPEAEAAPPAWPGLSLLSLLDGKTSLEERSIVVETDEDYLGFKMRTLVTRRYRLTMYSNREYGELFDLQADPNEFNNLWDRLEARELRWGLSEQLLHELVRTDISLPRQASRS